MLLLNINLIKINLNEHDILLIILGFFVIFGSKIANYIFKSFKIFNYKDLSSKVNYINV